MFWYLLHLTLKGKCYCLASKDDIKGKLDVIDPSNGHTMWIPHLEPNEAQWTLGILLAWDGSNHHQLYLLKHKAQQWANSIRTSHLHANKKWITYRSILKLGILYPLYQPINALQRISSPFNRSLTRKDYTPRILAHTFPVPYYMVLLNTGDLEEWVFIVRTFPKKLSISSATYIKMTMLGINSDVLSGTYSLKLGLATMLSKCNMMTLAS